MASVAATNILDLNEDCLRRVFTELNLFDLCSVARTCTWFQTIAECLVPKDSELHLRQQGPSNYRVVLNAYRPRICTRDEVETIFVAIGSLLTKVTIVGDDINNELCLTGQPCTKIPVVYDDEPEVTIGAKLKLNWEQLHSLTLVDISLDKGTTLFAGLNSLVSLDIRKVTHCRPIFESTFPKLEYFVYHGFLVIESHLIENPRFQVSAESFLAFISRHNRLKDVWLCFTSNEEIQTMIMQTIGRSCNDLIELTISFGSRNERFLRPLNALKSLETVTRRVGCCALTLYERT